MQYILQIQKGSIGREEVLIQDVNIDLEPGKLVILTGVNGSGKSSLLKSLAGIIPIKNGLLLINGLSVASLNRKEMSMQVSFAGTERIHEDYITIDDLVRFGRFPYAESRMPSIEIDYVQNAMLKMGILPLKDKYLDKVSDGEWQKANIARALAQNTNLIILDEPSAFLDYPSRNRLFADLKAICADGKTSIIISTHDVEIAQKFGDIFWHIDKNALSVGFNPPIWEN